MNAGPVTYAPVLVTGATGFIGSEIIRQLLVSGYRVRGTVRDPEKTQAEGHLSGLPGADKRLELVKADLLTPRAFDQAVVGAEYVIHTASPYVTDIDSPQTSLIEPALQGTLSVLGSSERSPDVKRVVLTSSAAAITDAADGHVNTEEEWNVKSSLTRNPYYLSKTLAERAAWDFVETRKPRFDLVAINPFLVIGPSLVPGLNTSNSMIAGLTNGVWPGIVALHWPLVDVRDVARAHILAMESPGAVGRHLVAADSRTMRQVVDLLRENGWDRRYKLPSIGLDNPVGTVLVKLAANFQKPGARAYVKNHIGGRLLFDNSKVRNELGLGFRDVDQTIIDAMEDMEGWGHLGKRR